MIATTIISITTFVLILLSLFLFPKVTIGKISFATYWAIALLGAAILLIFSLAPIDEVWNQLITDKAINPIKILVLFFSMTSISIFLDEFGLFQYLASIAVKVAKNNQYVLFFSLYVLVALLTIFTSNDIVILTLTPFIVFFCKRTNINPLPYLIAEFTAANTWSLMLIIGNPTNIFLATSAGIDFIDYFKVMAIPTLCAGLVEALILFILFRNKLSEKITEIDAEKVKINSKSLLIIGIVHLVVCLVFLVISSYINVEMWLVCLICALSLFLCTFVELLFTHKNWNYIHDVAKRMPYSLIPFFLSMFVIVVALNYQGIASEISKFFGENNVIWVYGYTSLVSSNIINNIPMSILYANLASGLSGLSYRSAIFASIIGSNIGAFLTPMGALAGIMFTNLLNKYEVKFSFVDFVKYGVVVAIPVITVALTMLNLTISF